MLIRAAITLRNTDTNLLYTASSNPAGYYILTNLPPGNYLLAAEAAGFRRYEQMGVVLRVGQVATIDIAMKIGTVSEKIEVNSEAPIIEPNRSEVSQVIQTEQIRSLPISGRLFTDFALLSPGVTTG